MPRPFKRRIVLLGPPACGKGTQAELIKARYGLPTASTGAMLRAEKKAGTPLGQEADRLTRDGGMVPDAMVLGIVNGWLDTHTGGFIFDGFPRTVPQGEALAETLQQRGQALDIVFFFDITHETIFERVMHRLTCSQCGRSVALGLHVQSDTEPCPACGAPLIRRADDSAESVEKRLTEYQEKTAPLVEFYQKQGLLWTIHTADRPTTVFEEIVAALEPLHP